ITLHNNINIRDLISSNTLEENIIKLFLNNKKDIIKLLYGSYTSAEILIDAKNPLTSVDNYITKPKFMNSFWRIKYVDQSGVDGGGLIRDFYYILGNEIKMQLSKKDDFYYINKETKNDSYMWFKIGLMFGKMLVIEKL